MQNEVFNPVQVHPEGTRGQGNHSKGRQHFCRHCFDQKTICTWTILWEVTGNLSWVGWCSEKLVLAVIHRTHIFGSWEHIFHSKAFEFLQFASHLIQYAVKNPDQGSEVIIAGAGFEQPRRQHHAARQCQWCSRGNQGTEHHLLYDRRGVSDGVRTDSKEPGSPVLTWASCKSSAIPCKIGSNHSQNEIRITCKNKQTIHLNKNLEFLLLPDWHRFLQQRKW